MLRVVIDPGVLVAALLSSKGAPAQLLLSWRAGMFGLVVSPALIAELTSVLARPKFRRYVSQDDADSYVELLRREGLMTDDPPNQERFTADPDDDYLVALARVSGANALVSGDPHLLELEEAQPPDSRLGAFWTRFVQAADDAAVLDVSFVLSSLDGPGQGAGLPLVMFQTFSARER